MADSDAEKKKCCSVVQAINDKYCDDEPLDFIICVPKKGGAGKGAGGDVHVPPNLTLDRAGITTAGDPGELGKICSRVRELDLTDNAITDWAEVFTILDSLPCLTFLNLTGNPTGQSDIPISEKSYPRINCLVLNRTCITWERTVDLVKYFPSISELHLSLNNLCSMSDAVTDSSITSVTKLYLNESGISDISQLARVGSLFPNLQNLIMIKNKIRRLDTDYLDNLVGSFPKLNYLNISEGEIDSWEELEKLRRLTSLTDLRLQGIPIWQNTPEPLRRQLTVSYLPNVTRLNGTEISSIEREDAERAFIRYYMDADDKPNRYAELEAVYGKLDPLVEINLGGNDEMSVVFHYCGNTKSQVITVNRTWSVETLRSKLREVSGETDKSKIYLLDIGHRFPPRLLKDTQGDLHACRVKDGDELFLDKKPEWKKTATLQAAVQGHLHVSVQDVNKLPLDFGYECNLEKDIIPELPEWAGAPHVNKMTVSGIDNIDIISFTFYCRTCYNLTSLRIRARFTLALREAVMPKFGQFLPKLEELDLTDSGFASWLEIQKLRWLPALKELRIRGSAVWEDAPEEYQRPLVIGYLPKLEKLNGEDITSEEREGAEKAFLEYYKDKNAKPIDYDKLKEKYA